MITARRYTDSDRPAWDAFAAFANSGTLFHRRDFLAYHRDRHFVDHSLLFQRRGRVLALFPAAAVEDRAGGRALVSHPGTSFAGFAFDALSYADCRELIASLEAHCRTEGFGAVRLVPTPTCYWRTPDETLEYALRWHGYLACEHYVSGVIELDAPERVLFQRVHRGRKRSPGGLERIRRRHAIRNEWTSSLRVFYPMLLENKGRYGAKPTHSPEELAVLRDALPGRLAVLMSYAGDQPIAGSLLFAVNSRVALIFYSAMDYRYRHLQPATLQVLELVRWAKRRGFLRLDFGVSHEPQCSNPLTPKPSLIHFKEQFGARGVIRRVFEKRLVDDRE